MHRQITHQNIRTEIQSAVKDAGFIGRCVYFEEPYDYEVYCSDPGCSKHIIKFLEPYYKWDYQKNISARETFRIKASIKPDLVFWAKSYFTDGEKVAVKLPTLSRFDTYSRKKSDEKTAIYWIEDTDTYILIEKEEIFIVAANEKGLNINVIRVIRDTTQLKFQNNGGVFFHSTAFCDAANGVVIMGDKGAGKTTLLFKYIMNYNFQTVSLDRSFLYQNDTGISLYGWPNSLNLGMGTIRANSDQPEMQQLLSQGNEQKYKDFDTEFQWNDKDKIHLNPYEVSFLRRQDQACLRAIIFASFEKSGKEAVKQITDQRLSALLEENCYSPYDPNFKNWHELVTIEKICHKYKENIVQSIINTVPCYEMIYNADTIPENLLAIND